jgi:hypothetical protein
MPCGEEILVRPRTLLAEQGRDGLVVDQDCQFGLPVLLVGELRITEAVPGRLPVRGSKQIAAQLIDPTGHE